MKKSGTKFASNLKVLEGPIRIFDPVSKKKQSIIKMRLGALLIIKPMRVLVIT